MQRFTAFGVSPAIARDMTMTATESIERERIFDENEIFLVHPPQGDWTSLREMMESQGLGFAPSGSQEHNYTKIIETPEQITLRRLIGSPPNVPVEAREMGFPDGAEVVLVIRVGEIIGNVLRRLRAISIAGSQ